MLIKYIAYQFLFIIVFLMITGCGKEGNNSINVDPVFQKYVDAFINSGKERGIEIDFSDTGLQIQFGGVDDNAAATCSELGSENSGSHVINVSRIYWNEADELGKEVLLFHELGHCELGRIHDNQIFSLGDWKSIMRGVPIPDKNPAVHFFGLRKEYYVNELFNPAIDFPSWINLTPEYDLNSEGKEMIFEFQDRPSFDTSFAEGIIKYQLDYSFTPFSAAINVEVQFGNVDKEESYIVSLASNQENLLTFYKYKVGHLNVLNIDADWNKTEKNIFRISNNGDRIDLFLNGKFLYWLEGENVDLKSFDISESSGHRDIFFSGQGVDLSN